MDRERDPASSNDKPENDQAIVQSFLETQELVEKHYQSLPPAQQRTDARILYLLEEVNYFGQHAATGQIIYTRRQEPIVASSEILQYLTGFWRDTLDAAKQSARK